MPVVPPHSHRQTRSAGASDHGDLEGLEDDDHPQYLKPEEVLAGPNVSVDILTTPGSVIITASGGGAEGGVTDHGMLTGLTPDDDHPQYHTDARGDARYDSKGTATAAVSAHAAAADPHPVYLTAAEGTAAYDAKGTAAAGDAAHVAAADPHPQYMTDAEGDTRFVNVTGDTVTGPLALTKQTTFSGTTDGDRVLHWPAADAQIYIAGDGQFLLMNTAGSAYRNIVVGNATNPQHAATLGQVTSADLAHTNNADAHPQYMKARYASSRGFDWNVTQEGQWILGPSDLGTPPPGGLGWWVVEVINYSPDWTIQRAYNPFNFGVYPEIYERGKVSAGRAEPHDDLDPRVDIDPRIQNWTPWRKSEARWLQDQHLADADPHPQYLTSAEGNTAYDPAGAASSAVTAHEAKADPHPVYLTSAEADAAYVNVTTDTMSGTLTVQDLVIKGDSPGPGLVWTAGDTLGGGSWQEPSALVVAETSDPILINWFDQSPEGWAQYSGAGSLTFTEMNSPSMPGVLASTGDVWAEWQYGDPMVFEPGALYRVTVRARLDAAGVLSFGFQGYNPDTPATVVDAANVATTTNPHWCAVGLIAGDAAWIDDVVQPGEWLAWTGYISGKTDAAAEGIPVQGVAPAEAAVKVAGGAHQWRPAFHASAGKVWIDAIEVHRLERSLELPGGIRVSDVYAETVSATSVTTENLALPPSVPGHLLTAADDAGTATWQPMPVVVNEGPPPRTNLLTENQATGTDALGTTVGFTAASATLASSTTSAVVGERSLAVTLTATGSTTGTYLDPVVPVVVGQTYTAMASFRYVSGTARIPRLRIMWLDAGAVYVGQVDFNGSVMTSDWTQATLTAVAPANAASARIYAVTGSTGLVGDVYQVDALGFWEGETTYPDAPVNPETIMLGTSYGHQSGMAYVISANTSIVTTVPSTRVPGSKAIQFSLVTPAMVTCRSVITYLNIYVSSAASLYGNVHVLDEAGTLLLTDEWGGPTTSPYVGGFYARITTGGNALIPAQCLWKRYLQPGTYTAYQAGWCSAYNAAEDKRIGLTLIEVDIDPNCTYLTGQRP